MSYLNGKSPAPEVERRVTQRRFSPKCTRRILEEVVSVGMKYAREWLGVRRSGIYRNRRAYTKFLDEGQDLYHWRTLYRILQEADPVGVRRDQRRPT